jgi:hypothetical protein
VGSSPTGAIVRSFEGSVTASSKVAVRVRRAPKSRLGEAWRPPSIHTEEVCNAMWWKVQCEARTNKKFAAAGRDASWLWFCANCWAREQLTDGHVPKMMLASLVPGMSVAQVRKAVAKLIETKLAHSTEDGGFTIHDFLEYHPSKEKVQLERQADSARKQPKNAGDSARKHGADQGTSELPRTRVGDSPSTSASVDQEQEKSEVVQRQGVQGRGAYEPNSLPREHMNHSVCGAQYRQCLTAKVFGKFVAQYGGDLIVAETAIKKFIDQLEIEHQSLGDFLWLQDQFTAHLRQLGRLKDAQRTSPSDQDRRLDQVGSKHEETLRKIASGEYRG